CHQREVHRDICRSEFLSELGAADDYCVKACLTFIVFSSQEGSWSFRMGCGPASIAVLLPVLTSTCSDPMETNATGFPVASTRGDPVCPAGFARVKNRVPQMCVWPLKEVGGHDTPSSASMYPP